MPAPKVELLAQKFFRLCCLAVVRGSGRQARLEYVEIPFVIGRRRDLQIWCNLPFSYHFVQKYTATSGASLRMPGVYFKRLFWALFAGNFQDNQKHRVAKCSLTYCDANH